MGKYIESKYIGDRYAEIGFELTDSQKATIIWNKYSLTYNVVRKNCLLQKKHSKTDGIIRAWMGFIKAEGITVLVVWYHVLAGIVA